jgi:hypothetical protein
MDIEAWRNYDTRDEFRKEALLLHLTAQEEAGSRLVKQQLLNAWFDDLNGVMRWGKVEVSDWRTGEILGTYTPSEYASLSFEALRWYDAEYYVYDYE